MLDAANGLTDLDGIADGVLVFEDDVETGDDVADEVLRAETDGEADKAGKRGDRGDVDAKLTGSGEQSHGPDDLASRAVDHAGKRARLLLASLGSASLRGSRL